MKDLLEKKDFLSSLDIIEWPKETFLNSPMKRDYLRAD